MWHWLVETLRHHPEMALFLTLALGYWIGKIRIGSVTLGAVVGVLIAGAVIGQIGIVVSSDLKTAFFLLFLFAIGYRCGPQFFSGLRASGLPQVALTVVLCGTGLVTAYLLAKGFGFDAGTAAGLIAGALTESAAVGTGTDALNRLGIDAGARKELSSNLAVAFAVTYFLGVITTVTFLSRVGPRLLGADLAAACKALEQEMGVMTEDAEADTGYRPFDARAYRVERDAWAGRTVGDLERAHQEARHRIFVPRIRRGAQLLEARPNTRIQKGDVIALAGRRAFVIPSAAELGGEVDDRALLDFPVDSVDAVLTNGALVRRTLGHLEDGRTAPMARGVALLRVTRAGTELPLTAKTKLARGDVLTLTGHRPDLERVVKDVGYADRPTHVTDMVAVCTALFLGGLVGIPALAVGKLDIGLSQSVGVLLAGLVFGWLRSVNRRFSRIPAGDPVVLRLRGPHGVPRRHRPRGRAGLRGWPAEVRDQPRHRGSDPHRRAARRHAPRGPVPLPDASRHPARGMLRRRHLGAGAGRRPGGRPEAGSPRLGYGVTYAVGNVLLALWGSVIVALMHGG